jgi:hypothetical protein
MYNDDRAYDEPTTRNLSDEDIAAEIEREFGRSVTRPTPPTPTVGSVTDAIPAQLRSTFQVVTRLGYVVVEYTNDYASAQQRNDEIYDLERALKSAGFTTWRGVFSVEVHAAE